MYETETILYYNSGPASVGSQLKLNQALPYPSIAATTSCIIPESRSSFSLPSGQPPHSSPFGSFVPLRPPVAPCFGTAGPENVHPPPFTPVTPSQPSVYQQDLRNVQQYSIQHTTYNILVQHTCTTYAAGPSVDSDLPKPPASSPTCINLSPGCGKYWWPL